MSTSYSPRANLKLFRLLDKLLRLLDASQKKQNQLNLAASSASSQHNMNIESSLATEISSALTQKLKYSSRSFESVFFCQSDCCCCSCCFLPNRKIKLNGARSRCFNSTCENNYNTTDLFTSKCSSKCSMLSSAKSKRSCSRFDVTKNKSFFSLNDFHIANACLFIFFWTIIYLYKYQSIE